MRAGATCSKRCNGDWTRRRATCATAPTCFARYGNMSSAFVYFVLQAALADDAQPGWWWMSAFGAGFSCHGALLQAA